MGYITFNGNRSDAAAYGIKIAEEPSFTIPQRDIELTHVNGRNGDLVWDYGSFQNVERRYSVSIPVDSGSSVSDTVSKLSKWLYTTTGYAELSDSYDTTHYRLAMPDPNAGIEVSHVYSKAIQAEIVFICKPQRFLSTADRTRIPTSGGLEPGNTYTVTITNSTLFNSYPLLRFDSATAGSKPAMVVNINGQNVTFQNFAMNNPCTYDCETAEFYRTSDGCNYNSYAYTTAFPYLQPGSNTVEVTVPASTLTGRWYINFYPRAWEL